MEIIAVPNDLHGIEIIKWHPADNFATMMTPDHGAVPE
jgi:hypothetical protein